MDIAKCNKCGSEQIFVIDSRRKQGSVYRRKKCQNCGERFTTYEVTQENFEAYLDFLNKVSGISLMLDEIKNSLPNNI